VTVLVTGATGFVGVRLVPRLVRRGHHVITVSRRAVAASPGTTHVVADIADADALARAMAGVDVVLHLAATTGKASPAQHHATIVGGTRTVIEACQRAGVPRLIAVSSIAAGFAEIRDYPYAQGKRAAEDLVRGAPMRTAIVRPTAIFGPGSAVQRGLTGLACAPVLPVIGTGTVPLQPIHVDDVAEALAEAASDASLDGQTIELGGPEALPVAALLRRLRSAHGKGEGPAIRLPAWLVIGPLRIAERLGLGGVLPVSAGQFSSFVHSGNAQPHPWTAARASRLTGLDVMIAESALPPDVAPSVGSSRDPVEDPATLARECATFTAHVVGGAPTPAVVDAYVRAHTVSPRFDPETAFDRRLVAFARRHRAAARFADQYARLAAPTSLLRRKLVLLLAILETTPPHYRAIDAPLAGGRLGTVAALAGRGVAAAAAAIVAVVVLAPLHAVSRGPGRA
jgi:nucleoside-diphosphate-sugar epimerase